MKDQTTNTTQPLEQYSYSEESIPLSLQPWFWKRKNSVSPAAKCQSRTEAWKRSVTPSGSQIPEDSVKIDPETKPQTTNQSSVPLPGSIIEGDMYSEKIQDHPSCVIKSVLIEDTCEEDGEEKSWLHKLGMNINKWSFLNSLVGWSENTALEKGHLNISGVCSDADRKGTELQECTTKEEEPYIPYQLATLFVIKIVKDMQKMKNKHMKIIRELDNIRKENQEQTMTAIKKHYSEKMSSLKSHLKAYLELMSKSNRHWQDTAKSLRERNRQLIQKNEDLLHQMRQQTEKWEEEKVWILENLCKNRDYLYTQHTLTLQELHIISLYVERMCNLMNFQMKNVQQKSEKAEGEKADVSEVLELKTEQVANEEEKPEWSMEKGYLWQAYTMLEKIQESLWKREREITELLQSERRYNKAMKPQITVLLFLKTLVKKVHTIYCDVPEAKQYISQLIRKNEDEKSDRKEAFNNAQADILSYEVLYGNEPTDDKRTQLSMKLFRNLGKAKSDLECVETEKIVFDSIQTGEIPNWIKRDCLYVALTEDPATCSEETETPFRGTHAEL
ncbi:synaptonemal complex protein 1-like [Pezoporus flaviventris]|uniref:synaptonemal complex protein 1-like n=1 Tax=Pezoporus flaviventris TaxID=889875 RepID=UPI002AB3231E|nr:synaptonemal complex protein 1-like [Pezoporus flaviventris]